MAGGAKYGTEPRTETAKKSAAGMRRRGRPPKSEQVNPRDVAKKIQVVKLIKVLEDVAINGTKISKERLKAIEILLRKAIPDLKAMDIEHSGEQKVVIEFLSNVKRKLDQDG